MRFGSRYPWEELLERGTGEPLNPQYLIAQLGL
jgi:Zn-dependent M32 family carboxypeptidase